MKLRTQTLWPSSQNDSSGRTSNLTQTLLPLVSEDGEHKTLQRHLTVDQNVYSICPGRYLAINSAWLAIASTLWAFRISKVLDSTGNEIEPTIAYRSGTVRCVDTYVFNTPIFILCHHRTFQSRSTLQMSFDSSYRTNTKNNRIYHGGCVNTIVSMF